MRGAVFATVYVRNLRGGWTPVDSISGTTIPVLNHLVSVRENLFAQFGHQIMTVRHYARRKV